MKRCLDLFCGGGGAARGYQLAGYDVTGIDIVFQNNYPGFFIRADALDFLERHGRAFDLIHASPPCQGYSSHVTSKSSRWNHTNGKDEPRLIGPLRKELQACGRPWVIENVIGAQPYMNVSLVLCGSMFGLPIPRHRIFESSELLVQPAHPKCRGIAKRYAETKGWEHRDMTVTGKGRHAGTAERWKEIMGIDWGMTQHQLAEAIPPQYTRYIGEQILALHSAPYAKAA